MTERFLIAAALGLTLSTGALAQSYNAPAGIPAATAPGGLEGRAAGPNLIDARGPAVRADAPYGLADDLTTGSVRRQRGDRGGPHAR